MSWSQQPGSFQPPQTTTPFAVPTFRPFVPPGSNQQPGNTNHANQSNQTSQQSNQPSQRTAFPTPIKQFHPFNPIAAPSGPSNPPTAPQTNVAHTTNTFSGSGATNVTAISPTIKPFQPLPTMTTFTPRFAAPQPPTAPPSSHESIQHQPPQALPTQHRPTTLPAFKKPFVPNTNTSSLPTQQPSNVVPFTSPVDATFNVQQHQQQPQQRQQQPQQQQHHHHQQQQKQVAQFPTTPHTHTFENNFDGQNQDNNNPFGEPDGEEPSDSEGGESQSLLNHNQQQHQQSLTTTITTAIPPVPIPVPASSYPEPTPSNPFPQYAREDDIPLLDELGIDLSLIFTKTKQIIKLPFSSALREHLRTTLSHTNNNEYDLTGPLVFCLLLGVLLMVFQGKMHFGYIYGFTMIGCIGIWFICNVLCDFSVSIDLVLHVIGYSLVPLLALPFVRLVGLTMLHSWVSIIQLISFGCILASTTLATLYFESIINLTHQRYIIAYPIALFYALFTILIMF